MNDIEKYRKIFLSEDVPLDGIAAVVSAARRDMGIECAETVEDWEARANLAGNQRDYEMFRDLAAKIRSLIEAEKGT